MTDPWFRSAVELAGQIRDKRIGCRELLEGYLARIDRYNGKLNAVIATVVERARKRADDADAALARGEIWGPLHGVPITVKESYDVIGLPTTWGAPEFKNRIASRNALAVDRLMTAGAVVFGKTNVPLMLADCQSYNAVYGTTSNPWDTTRTPGGSSGGAAAALAAGLTGLEAGSDIGSSLRNPAHYCGVYAHKPTWGIVSPRGHAVDGRVAYADISVVGPMARSAADLEIALAAMAGPDEIDGQGWRVDLPRARHERLSDFRVAVMLSVPHAEVDDAVQTGVRSVADALAKSGARIDDRASPDIDTLEVDRLFRQLLGAALSGRQPDEAFRRNLERSKTVAPGDFSNAAQNLRAATLHHRDWLIGNEARHKIRLKWAEFFKDYDVLICPAVTTVAFPHNQVGDLFERTLVVNGRERPTAELLFWAGYSGLFYLPSTVAPAALTPQGLPTGVQIIGPQYGDLTCIRLARLLEREYRGFVPPSGYGAS